MAKLLIVDNDPDRLLELGVIAAQTRFSDHDVVTAATREGGEARLVDLFDFAVIDIALRGDLDEEGVDLIRLLHMQQPRCGIIALTSHKLEAEKRALEAGATFFINARNSDRDWRPRVKEKLATLQQIVRNRTSSD
jgi:CheY-like chemotaxis protein